MKKLGRRQRDNTLLLDDYQCCLCGLRFFCDVHHIKPRSEGGSHDEANLATLCPTCHRAVHRGEVTQAALRRRRANHREAVLRQRKGTDKVSFIQLLFIYNFIDTRFGSAVPEISDYSEQDQRDLFLIAFDFDQAGIVTHPSSGKPLVIEENDIHYLAGLEAVITSSRARFLRAWHRSDQARERYYVVRFDVVDFLVGEETVLAAAQEYDDADMRAALEDLEQWNQNLAELIEADIPLDFQRRNMEPHRSEVDDSP